MYGGGGRRSIILYLECIITDVRDTHVYIWFQYCSHSNIPCMEINWSWEPPPQARKLACLESLFWRVFWPENPQDGEFSRTGKLARVQVETQKLMRVSWQVQVAHKPVLVATVDTVKALKC